MINYTFISSKMADRVTQLQDLVMQQAENILISISIIEKNSEPYIFPDIVKRKPKLSKKELKLNIEEEKKKDEERNDKQEMKYNFECGEEKVTDYPYCFAKKIAQVAVDINTLIDSLPDDSMISPELQVESLKRLEQENLAMAKQLEDIVFKSEMLLERVRVSLALVSSEYLKTFFPE